MALSLFTTSGRKLRHGEKPGGPAGMDFQALRENFFQGSISAGHAKDAMQGVCSYNY